VGADRGDGGDDRRLALLAAEAAAHAAHFRRDGGLRHAEHERDVLRHFGRVLGRGPHVPLPFVERRGDRDVGFEIEMILAADRHRTANAARRGIKRRLQVAALKFQLRHAGEVRIDAVLSPAFDSSWRRASLRRATPMMTRAAAAMRNRSASIGMVVARRALLRAGARSPDPTVGTRVTAKKHACGRATNQGSVEFKV